MAIFGTRCYLCFDFYSTQSCHCPCLGADPEETILNAFKVFDPEGKGALKKDLWVNTVYCSSVRWLLPSLLIVTACLHSVTEMLTTQADRFSPEEVKALPLTMLHMTVALLFIFFIFFY